MATPFDPVTPCLMSRIVSHIQNTLNTVHSTNIPILKAILMLIVRANLHLTRASPVNLQPCAGGESTRNASGRRSSPSKIASTAKRATSDLVVERCSNTSNPLSTDGSEARDSNAYVCVSSIFACGTTGCRQGFNGFTRALVTWCSDIERQTSLAILH